MVRTIHASIIIACIACSSPPSSLVAIGTCGNTGCCESFILALLILLLLLLLLLKKWNTIFQDKHSLQWEDIPSGSEPYNPDVSEISLDKDDDDDDPDKEVLQEVVPEPAFGEFQFFFSHSKPKMPLATTTTAKFQTYTCPPFKNSILNLLFGYKRITQTCIHLPFPWGQTFQVRSLRHDHQLWPKKKFLLFSQKKLWCTQMDWCTIRLWGSPQQHCNSLQTATNRNIPPRNIQCCTSVSKLQQKKKPKLFYVVSMLCFLLCCRLSNKIDVVCTPAFSVIFSQSCLPHWRQLSSALKTVVFLAEDSCLTRWRQLSYSRKTAVFRE